MFKSRLKTFKENLEKNKMFHQQGFMDHAVIFKSVNKSNFPNCFDNNADARYVVANIPPPYPEKENLPPMQKGDSALFRIREDEAIVLIGKTPPVCKYFSFTPYIYERYSEKDMRFHEVFNSLNDPINNLTINTNKDSPFDAETVIIFCSEDFIKTKVENCLVNSGYDLNSINLSIIPSQLLRMGTGFKNDILMCLFRFYGYGESFIENYYNEIILKMAVLRITPDPPPSKLNLYKMPELRVRGTGVTEMDLMPAMEKLRISILNEYESQGWKATEYTTDIWLEEGLQALQANKNMFGENRDVTYMNTESFTMYDQEFAVIYGVNHTVTGKAVYCSAAVYGKEYYNGVKGSNSMPDKNWVGSADKFIPDENDRDKFFVLTACRENPKPVENPDILIPTKIVTQGIQKFKPLFIGFRNYLEKKTKSGPVPEEMISPRVIKFSKPMYGE